MFQASHSLSFLYLMEGNNNSSANSFHFDILAFLRLCLKQWKWFVIICFLAAVYGVYSYLKNPPKQQICASVMLPTMSGTNNMVLDLAKNFSFGDMFGGSSSTENESMVLGSYDQFLRTTRKLGLNVGYQYKSKLNWKNIHLNPPIKVDFPQSIADTLTIGHIFELTRKKDDKFDISVELFKKDFEFKNLTMPCTVKLPTGEFSFYTTEVFKKSKSSKFRVIVSSYNDAAQVLASTVDISIPNKKADFLGLSYLTNEPEFGILLLNTVIESYNDIADSQKDQRNNRTLQMVNNRLSSLSDELRTSEHQIETFKAQHNLTDIEADAQLLLQQVGKIENSLLVAETENAIIKSTRDFINNPDNQYQLIPALGVGVKIDGQSAGTNNSANDAISEYNKLVLERMKMLTSAKNNNATLKLLDDQLDALLANIKESVERAYVNSNIALKDVRSKAGSTQSVINAYPTLEREYLGMKRDQLVQEQLYLFLLKQREETSISLSTNTQSCVTIDQPHVMSIPVGMGPFKKIFVYLVFGGIIALALVFLLKYMKVGFFNLAGLKAVAKVPVLGEISGCNAEMDVTVTPATAQTRADVMFTLDRINGKRVLVTAPTAGQYSDFAAIALAASFAEVGKKTVLIDADYRAAGLDNTGASLADFTSGSAAMSDILHSDYMGISGLDGIPAGKADVPGRVLSSARMFELIDRLTEEYDYVFIAASEVGSYSETYALAPVSDLTLMIVLTGEATPGDIKKVNDLAEEGRFPNIALIATSK